MMHRNRDEMPPEDDVNGASNGNTSAGGKPADATGGAILAIDAVEFPGDGANSKTNESNDGDGIIKKAVNGVAKSEVNGAANGSSSEGAAKSGAGSKKEFGAHSGTMKKMMTEAGEVVMVDMDNGKDEEDKKEDNQPCFPGMEAMNMGAAGSAAAETHPDPSEDDGGRRRSVRHRARLAAGEEPTSNTCSVCGKSFNGKHALVRHMMIHTGQ